MPALDMTDLVRLSDVYGDHHRSHERGGFVFCGNERTPIFRQAVGTGKHVLDLGCRTGVLTSAFLDGNDVVGVDVDREALREARRRGIETVWADVDEGLPLADESFDAVVAGELLEHVRFPERVVEEVRRLLRPGGLFVGSVPNSYRLKSRLRFLRGGTPQYMEDPTHLRMLNGRDMERLLSGFERVELRYVAGRLAFLNGPLFAVDIVFLAHLGQSPEALAGNRRAA
jgi:SAM-dependent methyltransferase